MLKKCFSHDAVSVFKKIAPTYRVGIKTNANNQITVASSTDERDPMLCYSFLSRFGRYSKMSDEIVNDANVVLKKVNSETTKEVKKDPIKEENEELKATIELIKNQLAILLSREPE